MKNIYVLTCHDGNTKTFNVTQHYSTQKAAKESFLTLKNHMAKKYDIVPSEIENWSFNTNDINKTVILAKRFNITLTAQSVHNQADTWL